MNLKDFVRDYIARPKQRGGYIQQAMSAVTQQLSKRNFPGLDEELAELPDEIPLMMWLAILIPLVAHQDDLEQLAPLLDRRKDLPDVGPWAVPEEPPDYSQLWWL